MSFYDNPRDSLSGNLRLVVDNYESDRQAYWSDDKEVAHLIHVCDLLAEGLLGASENLVVQPSGGGGVPGTASPWEKVVRIAERDGFIHALSESLEILIARGSINGLSEAGQRCLALTRHILSTEPGEPVARYLRRLGRCYIAGFLPECVVLCRAVLENAVKETFDRHRVPLPATEQGASPMKTRLAAARMLGWLSAEAEASAKLIWERGNTAIHHDPEATADVLGTIKLTAAVLSELYA